MQTAEPQLTQLESLLWERNDARFLQNGRTYVEGVPSEGHPVLYRALEATQNEVDHSLRRRNAELRHLVQKEMNMPKGVERDGRKLVIANMHDIPAEHAAYADIHSLDLVENKWPLYASLIKLHGRLERQETDMSMVYFVHEGNGTLSIDGKDTPLTPGFQAAIPTGMDYHIDGKNLILYALECSPKISGSLALEDFNDEKKKNKCPCGWSYRIPLKESGWGFSTHRTKMKGVHDATHDGFAGHQHQCTDEIYFADSVSGPATMTLDGITQVRLSPGMLVAIPNGTMHAVDSDEEIVQHIFVGKGHKNDDFWTAGWRPLPKS